MTGLLIAFASLQRQEPSPGLLIAFASLQRQDGGR